MRLARPSLWLTLWLKVLAGLALPLMLASCSSTGIPGLEPSSSRSEAVQGAPTTPIDQSALAPLAGGTSGGPVRVALILPLSASGNAGVAAASLKNAAEMALSEFNAPELQLVVKDDMGTPEGARAAAEQALAEGSELILGPLFAPAAQAAGQVARPRQIPVVSFSTDANVAGQGTYLLSFLPQRDVERVVDHAFAQGRRSFAALIPDTAYGQVVEAAFQEAVAARGGRVVALARYPLDRLKMEGPVREIGKVVGGAQPQADALFLPDAGDALPSVAQFLQLSQLDTKKVQLIGTGLWNDPRVWKIPLLQGGLFAAPDSAGYNGFAQRYRTRYGTPPTRVAGLAYDGVALAVALIKTRGAQRFASTSLTDPQGFSGVDGTFRFRADGQNERGLAILRIQGQGTQTIAPAPRVLGQ
jgi:branched-chain amino acid transport system substrate-binding protein